ncbi:hypothetical protein L1987_05900 [Smallanthus sonchifolius]|uniref:Uncharacterized protein n=1 Tax=Smallanthus sonchifolius TaxID=185202 RepID=A0ACB9JWU4_9ASTR|nr:hypothetical protein L1987_05900 [Smallanthus sonchifolius]
MDYALHIDTLVIKGKDFVPEIRSQQPPENRNVYSVYLQWKIGIQLLHSWNLQPLKYNNFRKHLLLESHRAVTLNLKWKQIEEHFHGLEKSLKRRFTELEDQEKEFEMKTVQAQKVLEKRRAAVLAKEEASLARLQEKRDVTVLAISNTLKKNKYVPLESES